MIHVNGIGDVDRRWSASAVADAEIIAQPTGWRTPLIGDLDCTLQIAFQSRRDFESNHAAAPASTARRVARITTPASELRIMDERSTGPRARAD
jgi:hypothetical protein